MGSLRVVQLHNVRDFPATKDSGDAGRMNGSIVGGHAERTIHGGITRA